MTEENNISIDGLHCPLPFNDYDVITLAHGSGGKMMNNLVEKMFLHYLGNDIINKKHDGGVFNVEEGKLAFTTDSYVVKPLFFPGGDIGKLAVYGTVNDLSMCGAEPLYLTLGLIIEEGLPVKDLEKIIVSIKESSGIAGVKIISGDTKVVEKGKGDGLFINTSGVGIVNDNVNILPDNVREGDAVLISGDVGRHGIAIISARENLSFETKIESDCAPLNKIIRKLIDEKIEIHCLRDLTRGGLASALNEIASKANIEIEVEEKKITVSEEIKGACEILGFDPLQVANEGRFIAFVKKEDAEQTLNILKQEKDFGRYSSIIGNVRKTGASGLVILKSVIGSKRILDMLTGEQLPRIC